MAWTGFQRKLDNSLLFYSIPPPPAAQQNSSSAPCRESIASYHHAKRSENHIFYPSVSPQNVRQESLCGHQCRGGFWRPPSRSMRLQRGGGYERRQGPETRRAPLAWCTNKRLYSTACTPTGTTTTSDDAVMDSQCPERII